MKLKMTIDEAIAFADEWSRGMTINEGSQGWRVVCMLLANEVRTLQADAARYRWLRDGSYSWQVSLPLEQPEQLDKFIDAELAAFALDNGND
jgi:hypothetical protein